MSLQVRDGRLHFATSGAVLRQFFLQQGDGFALVSLHAALLVSSVAVGCDKDAIGESIVWMNLAEESEVEFWNITSPPPPKRAKTADVAEQPPMSALQAMLRQGFLAVSGKRSAGGPKKSPPTDVVRVQGPAPPPEPAPAPAPALPMVEESVTASGTGTDEDDVEELAREQAALQAAIAAAPGSRRPRSAPIAPQAAERGAANVAVASSSSAPPAPKVAPAPKAPPAEPRGRHERSVAWGPWCIAPVYARDVLVGWGATCGKHENSHDSAVCKRQLLLGKRNAMPEVECRSRLKAWLLAGVDIAPGPSSRHEHMFIKPRDIEPVLPEEELDFQASVLS